MTRGSGHVTPVQNIINQKIYLVLWWWYAFLAPITVIFIAYRIVTIFFQGVRFCLLCRRVRFNPRSIVSERAGENNPKMFAGAAEI